MLISQWKVSLEMQVAILAMLWREAGLRMMPAQEKANLGGRENGDPHGIFLVLHQDVSENSDLPFEIPT